MWLDLQKLSQITQELKSNLLVNIKLHSYTTQKRQLKHMIIDSQVCFHTRHFTDPIKPQRCTTESVGPVNGIYKDVSGARLLPTTVSTYPVDWVCFCHWRHNTAACVPPLATHSPPLVCPPLLRTICDIKVAVEKVQAVLAS